MSFWVFLFFRWLLTSIGIAARRVLLIPRGVYQREEFPPKPPHNRQHTTNKEEKQKTKNPVFFLLLGSTIMGRCRSLSILSITLFVRGSIVSNQAPTAHSNLGGTSLRAKDPTCWSNRTKQLRIKLQKMAHVEDDGSDMYEEETVVEEEEVIDESMRSNPVVSNQGGGGGLITLDENEAIEIEEEFYEEIIIEDADDADQGIGTNDLDFDDSDDESSAWVDDGRDYTKDPHIAPLIISNEDHFASEDAKDEDGKGDDDDEYYLNLPDIDEVSSLEDNLSEAGEESSDASFVLEEVYEEDLKGAGPTVLSSQSAHPEVVLDKLNQSADWGETSLEFDQPSKRPTHEEADFLLLSGRMDPRYEKHVAEQEITTKVSTTSSGLASQGSSSYFQRLGKKPIFVGRHKELNNIHDALNKFGDITEKNPKRCIWICGKGGIGKTALAEYFIREQVLNREESDSIDSGDGGTSPVIAVHGSFPERTLAHKPFSGLIDSLDELMSKLINEDIPGGISWRDLLHEGLGKDTILLAKLIPRSKQLFELKDTSPGEKPTSEAAYDVVSSRLFHRVRFILRRFFHILCEHRKVVMMLDDLHWADDDSMALIESVLSAHALANFLFIGCHRGVKPTHSLSRMKDKLSALCLADINMKPLGREDIGGLVPRLLTSLFGENPADQSAMTELSSWLCEKTQGDPLQLQQLLAFLVETKKVVVDAKGFLEWNLANLKTATYSLMTTQAIIHERMLQMPVAARLTAKSAAFLGVKVFDLRILHDVVQICATVDKKKWNACHIKDIVSLNHQVEILLDRGIFASIGPDCYSFSHDLFAKASLDLLPKAKAAKETMHFEFASYQEANLSAKFGDEHIAMVAMVMDHYNLYSMKKTGDANIERERFLKMYLRLSEDAMGKAAFATTVQRLETGLLLINQEEKWTDSYQACLNFHLQMSRVKFCQGKYDASKRFALTVVSKSKHPRDSIGALDLLIDLAIVTNNIEDAYQVALKGLMDIFGENLGGDVESEVASMRELVQSKSDADLTTLMPQIQHKKSATKLHFFTRLAEISWMKEDLLSQDLAALKMMEITLRYGASRSTSFALALYGICLGRRNLHKEAFRFGYLGAMTADETSKLGSQVIAVHHHSIAYWQRPFQASHNALRRTIGVAFDSNDMENLSFRVGAFLSLSLATGYRLDSCDETFKKFKEHAIAFHARDTWLATIPFRLTLLLRDEPINPTEKGFQKYTNARATQYSIFFQMVHAVIMQDMSLAEKLSVRLFHKPEGVWLPLRGFYEGLMATSLARDSTGKTRTKHQRKAAKIVAVLGAWAKTGMKQAYHMAFFLNCELRMLSGSNISLAQSCAMYDSVITATKKAGFLHHEAMANERAGAMLYLRHEDELATRYLTAAFQLYQRWGARAKLRAMKKKFPRHLDLPPEQLDARNTATSTHYASKAFAGSLDFGASQILHFDPREIGPSTTTRRGQGRGNKGRGRGSTLPGRGASGALAAGKKDGTNRSWSDMLPSLSPDPGKKDDAVEVEALDLSKNSPRNKRKKNKVDKSGSGRAKSPPKERGIVRHLSWNKKKKSKDLDSTQRSVDSLPSGGQIDDHKERKVPLLRLVKGFSWTKRNKKDTKPEVGVDDSSSDSSEDEALKKYFKQKGALSNSQVIEDGSDDSDEDEAPARPSSLSTGLDMGQKSKVRRKLKGSRKQPGDDTASVGDARERKPRSLSSGLDAHTIGRKSRSRSRSADPSKRKKKDSQTESLITSNDVGEKPKRRKSKTIALDATDICDGELKTIGKTSPQAQQSSSGSPIKISPTKDAGIISKAPKRKSVSKKVSRPSIQEEGSNIQRNNSPITKEPNQKATIPVAAVVPDTNTTKVKNTRSRSKSKTRSKSRDREGKRKESVERRSRSLSKSRRRTRDATDSPSGDHKKDKGRRESSRSRSRSRNGKDERKGTKAKKAGKKSEILASTITDHNAATSPDAVALGSTGEAEIDNPTKKKKPGLLYKVRRSLSKRNIDDDSDI